jgi:glycosyltransferase involved in cell wall biosynthesis
MSPAVSVVVSTYNRAALLKSAIESICGQRTHLPFELIVVDNNSTDATAAVVRDYAALDPRVRCLFEPKQGVAHGRNAGIAAARADLLLFTDDDVVPSETWIERMAEVCAAKPDCGCVGGCVLPLWLAPPPAWLTERHWAPLGLIQHPAAEQFDAANRKCLITGNMAVRREVFERVGTFSAEFQRVKGGAGTIEDREFQERYFNIGGKCWFDPSIVARGWVPPDRLRKSYHRRWHFGHGKMNALLRDPGFEASRIRLFGVPGHIYRTALAEAAKTALSTLRCDAAGAFTHEIAARFCAGFAVKRMFG